jgi:hypothetical protein
LAISLRCFDVSFPALDLPPFGPPSLPRATAAGFLSYRVDLLAISEANTFTALLERSGILQFQRITISCHGFCIPDWSTNDHQSHWTSPDCFTIILSTALGWAALARQSLFRREAVSFWTDFTAILHLLVTNPRDSIPLRRTTNQRLCPRNTYVVSYQTGLTELWHMS